MLIQYIYILRRMGWQYLWFRIWYLLGKKTGWTRFTYPRSIRKTTYNIHEWNQSGLEFLFGTSKGLFVPKEKSEHLRKEAEDILGGNIRFFNGETYQLGADYDWLTNPLTGKKYSGTAHWSEINDFEPGEDIKYIWEKARFCYILTILRYDYHFDTDHAEFVWNEILSWIQHADPNCGPHSVSSQEIAIRVVNWTMCLYYYRQHPTLNQQLFQTILQSIEWQAEHIYRNRNFARRLVRNNHVLTEALALFVIGIVFPFIPSSSKWKQTGQRLFEKEIEYQVEDDGTYLQYSMNYNRVVVQLLTFYISIARLNRIPVSDKVLDKARMTNRFLYSCMDTRTGELPNYGANDGSLFFPLNNHHFRDFRPQVQALDNVIDASLSFDKTYEDSYWFGDVQPLGEPQHHRPALVSFKTGGYYLIRDESSFAMIRCGNHPHRPSQADNLHFDLWYQSENILRDAGTFGYNCDPALIRFYFGTASHNTVMVNDMDQMMKGKRFIWYHWTSAQSATLTENDREIIFKGTINAFRQSGKWIQHQRTVIKQKGIPHWEIRDEIIHNKGLRMQQVWNPSPVFSQHFRIEAYNQRNEPIHAAEREGYYSETYGTRIQSPQIIFESGDSVIRTFISLQ